MRFDRTADEWINLGIIDGVRYPLPATVFVEKIIHKERIFDRDDKTLSNLFSWFPAAITDYDNKRKLWTVLTLDALKRKFLLPRIYIRFFGEDPRKFAQRIANAVKQRQIAEISIRLICICIFEYKFIEGFYSININLFRALKNQS